MATEKSNTAIAVPFNAKALAVSLKGIKKEVGPTLNFLKMGKDGIWSWGKEENEVDESEQLLINPAGFKHGYVCWAQKGSAKLGETMTDLGSPIPDHGPAPDGGRGWDFQLGVHLKLVSENLDLLWASASFGGKKEISRIADEVGTKLEEGSEDCVAVVTLGSDSYQHKEYGKIYTPELSIVKWISVADVEKMLSKGAPAKKAAPAAPAKKVPAKKK
jgi:hypothetical protein